MGSHVGIGQLIHYPHPGPLGRQLSAHSPRSGQDTQAQYTIQYKHKLQQANQFASNFNVNNSNNSAPPTTTTTSTTSATLYQQTQQQYAHAHAYQTVRSSPYHHQHHHQHHHHHSHHGHNGFFFPHHHYHQHHPQPAPPIGLIYLAQQLVQVVPARYSAAAEAVFLSDATELTTTQKQHRTSGAIVDGGTRFRFQTSGNGKVPSKQGMMNFFDFILSDEFDPSKFVRVTSRTTSRYLAIFEKNADAELSLSISCDSPSSSSDSSLGRGSISS